jgi:16S rRNA (cytosine1402-N4)-methyltransferase
MLRQVVATLAPKPGEHYLDCTAGLGGHAAAIAPHLMPSGIVILNDADPSNLDHAAANVALAAPGIRIEKIHGNFAELPHRLRALRLRADLVLADLGFASNQIDDAARGFSFTRDGPLDMRLNPKTRLSAADLVAGSSERDLARLLRELGEEQAANRIARKLVQARAATPITTTGQLADLVREALGPAARALSIHPATKTFQALRIAVNDELGSLEALLAAIGESARRAAKSGAESPAGSASRTASQLGAGRDLNAGSPGVPGFPGVPGESDWLNLAGDVRVGFLSFHSLEDRPIKRAFRDLETEELAEDLTSGAATPDEEEVRTNPRARSAKWRAIRLRISASEIAGSGRD